MVLMVLSVAFLVVYVRIRRRIVYWL
jgi:hypothetical protein